MLLDRDVEIAVLDRGLQSARDGRGAVVWLEGEAGTGKTRLLGELRERARQAGARVLTARGGPLEQGYAWGAVRQLLEPLLMAADDAERTRLTAGAAALAAPALHQAGTEVDDQATMHGLYWLVVNLADTAPVVLIVDDLQWVDVVSLRWLSYLVRRAHDLPLLVALSTRPDHASAEADALADDPLTHHLRPRPLTVGAVAALTTEALGAAPEPPFTEEIARVTGGNPFYVGALLGEARDAGLRGRAGEAPRLLALGPDSVGRTVLRRIGTLGDDALEVARALAALEEPATPEAVALVADRDPADTRTIAEALMRIGILDEQLPLDFVHPIVRHAVLDAVPLAQRPALNARAAAALAGQGADAERIAARLVHVPAGTPLPAPLDAAHVHLAEAADAALRRGAPAAALDYARRALAEPGTPPAQRVELDLLAARAEALEHAPGWEQRWASVVDRIPDPDARARARLQVVGGLISTGEFALAAALATLDEAVDPGLQVALEMNALQAGLMHVDSAAGTSERVRALIDAEAAGAPLTLYERAIVAFALMLWGEDAARARALAERLAADPALLAPGDASVAYITVTTLMFTGGYGPVLAVADGLCAMAAQTGSRAMLLGGVSGRGLARWGMGDLLAAEADADAVLDLFADIPPSAFDPFHLTTVAHVLIERGEAERALTLIAERAAPEPWPAGFQYASLHAVRASARLAADDVEGALAGARAAGEIAEALGLGPIFEWRLTAAQAQLRLGRLDAAAALAAAQLERAERAGLPRWVGNAQAVLGLVRADRALLEQAVETLADDPLPLTRAELLLGGALRRANRRNDALVVLRRAAERAQRHGLTALAEALAEELRVAGARPRRALADGVAALTAAERRVIDVAISGKTNREIAQTLFLTQKTVETHLSSAYRKLDIARRSELADAMRAA